MSSYKPVVILYEDQGGPRKEFGLHNLVVAMVNDLLANDFWRLRSEALKDGRPSKGNTKLLQKLKQRKELERMMGGGRHVIAVFDADRPPFTEQEFKEYREANELLHVVLLDRNMETVILAVAECEPSLASELVRSATQQKDHSARDSILNRIAYETHRHAIRDCVKSKVPSLSQLCELVAALVRT
ncbi:MAG TPA: hypothetical protein VEU33_15720 [Archangium sp.]|nr:hypothetical protein [Archangium sp.]